MTTSCAAFPTAAMEKELKTKTRHDPRRPPMNTSGIAISTLLNLRPLNADTSSIKAEKSRKQASAAEPIA